MQLPPVLDSSVRFLVLTAVGALLLIAVPDGAFGGAPVWMFAGRPGPTVANLIGMGVILAAWIYSMVVFSIRAAGHPDPICWVALTVDIVGFVGFVAMSLAGLDGIALGLLLLAIAAQLALPLRLGRTARRAALVDGRARAEQVERVQA